MKPPPPRRFGDERYVRFDSIDEINQKYDTVFTKCPLETI